MSATRSILLATQLLVVGGVDHVLADTSPNDAVDVVRVCTSAAGASERGRAAEMLAQARGWRLIASGHSPLPMMHNDRGPQVSTFRAWRLSTGDEQDFHFFESVVRPDAETVIPGMRGVKWNVCILNLPAAVDLRAVASAIEAGFGPAIIPQWRQGQRRPNIWVFTEDEKAGVCGRVISLARNGVGSGQKFTASLTVMDVSFPDHPDWRNAATMTNCRQ